MEFKNLEKALLGAISELKAVSYVPDGQKEFWSVDLERSEKDNSKWLTYMSEALKTATTFEIHLYYRSEQRLFIGTLRNRADKSIRL